MAGMMYSVHSMPDGLCSESWPLGLVLDIDVHRAWRHLRYVPGVCNSTVDHAAGLATSKSMQECVRPLRAQHDLAHACHSLAEIGHMVSWLNRPTAKPGSTWPEHVAKRSIAADLYCCTIATVSFDILHYRYPAALVALVCCVRTKQKAGILVLRRRKSIIMKCLGENANHCAPCFKLLVCCAAVRNISSDCTRAIPAAETTSQRIWTS